jgi:hypothetical protein
MKRIISVSKRTDIPCWHPEWFMERMRAGEVVYQNPMGPQIITVSLLKKDVGAFVFWTKNFNPMLPYMDEFESFGIPYYTQYTVNDYPVEYERKLASLDTRIKAFEKLFLRGRPVMWRYDPIIISPETPVDWHLEKFAHIASRLQDLATQCHISFLDMYAKTIFNMKKLPESFQADTLGPEAMTRVARMMSSIAAGYGIELVTCAETGVKGVKAGACIDGDIVRAISFEKPLKGVGNRPGCNCVQHRDIGAYDTCATGCVYCYAVTTPEIGLDFIKNEADATRPSLKGIPITTMGH